MVFFMLERMADLYKKRARSSSVHSVFFRKSLIIVLLITCLPTTFIGFSLYFVGVNRIESEVNKTHQLRLTQISRQLEDQLTQLEVRLSQWAFNPMFNDRLKTMDFAQEVDFTRDMLKTMLILQETNPLISEVYLYIHDSKTLISSSNGVTAIRENELKNYDEFSELMRTQKSIFWTKSIPLPGITDNPVHQKDFMYSLVHKLPGDVSEKYGALMVRLDKSKISSYFHELNDAGVSFLVDEEGDLLIQENQLTEEKTVLKNTLQSEIQKRLSDRKQDTFLYKFQGTTYSVSYYTLSRLGSEWIFATSSDLSTISGPVIMMSRLIISISMAGILTAFVLSWFASHRIYQPIARLIGAITGDKSDKGIVNGDELKYIEKEWHALSRESHVLQTKVEEQLPTLREGFMLQLVQGRLYYLEEEELRSRIAYYGWETEDQQYTVIALQLIGLSSAEGKFKEDDEQLVTFAAANIVNELTQLHMQQAYVINFQDLFVGIVIGLPSTVPANEIKKEMGQLSQEIISTLSSILKVQVTVCIGQLSTELGRISDLMEEARHTLRYRKLLEANQIIDMDSLFLSGDFTFHYPFEIEKELIHAIRLGQEEDAFRIAEEFIAELNHNAGVELYLQQAMTQLVGNVNNALLQAGFNVYHFHQGQNLYEEISQLRQTAEMLRWFKNSIISPYVSEMNQTYQAHQTQTVEKVVRLIEERYMTDLSLEECADLLGLNSSSLSKTFKQIKGINYVDYVTKIRIDASKKLLLETDLKISEIAERVGYQHSWFNRVFKKSEGVTPSQYRDNHH
ncbi:transcriptional regulator [Paenibacillus mucilaginosus K02]|uniref:Transcriptional regulator n=2 Tax=Paenibacillus mucilaginosus TaxID=61624 RepID=I0BFR0_9BACL|nr:transcriptional regulator [Paenibacillus mucilaginosus K02]